ncbi:uncharacterized protein GGS22DRAFT_152358 [Annulohypoxylon maeteangense]|uniref:uncharacterized protein n=1 Tax=Annulohypoxylon maeteangense TaxID=1927788 RepID=UPI002008C361|nr:uncharacterized protein GGS22DRAFT_152358 [Annulohypoxylon maeteangense]KAI0888793.1 hypothetical protein GGS22DRAFT_152358 [Annulohypoxylon maeteangense]
MGQYLSRRKAKRDGTPRCYVMQDQQWVYHDPSSSSFTYSPVFTHGRNPKVCVTEITNPNLRPYYERSTWTV